MNQLDLFEWADNRPTAKVIDIMPALISKIAREPYPVPPKNGDVVPLKRSAS
ncbi:hypothetical protein [Pararhizobium gei]|uniref:hypothetical protein n=1 Tax=Pararhizobium gei TaxID=1395951 RepID=UPI0023DA0BD7|nr:hypothetical protein [Rhizobium gei]